MSKEIAILNNKTPDYFLQENTTLPVDIIRILQKMNIDVIKESFDMLQERLPFKNTTIDAITYVEQSGLKILYDQHLDVKNKRFTLAHELAHCCLHMNANNYCHIELQTHSDIFGKEKGKLVSSTVNQEKIADKFARELLIPSSSLFYLLNKSETLSIEELSDIYGVPFDQMQKRIEEVYIEFFRRKK